MENFLAEISIKFDEKFKFKVRKKIDEQKKQKIQINAEILMLKYCFKISKIIKLSKKKIAIEATINFNLIS